MKRKGKKIYATILFAFVKIYFYICLFANKYRMSTQKTNKEFKKITTHALQAMKERGEKISMLTAYDFSMATILDDAGIDILVQPINNHGQF